MEKYIVKVEFRYRAIPKSDSIYASDSYNKEVTIGIYDTIDDAIKQGNQALETLKTKFNFADCFSKNGGIFGSPNKLVCNFNSKNKPQFFAKIETLHFDDLASVMNEVFSANEKWEQNKI